MRQVLSDLTVVEVASGCVAASYCAKLFADFGANVIKLESGTGDPLRRLGLDEADQAQDSGLFLNLNTNKRGILLDPDNAQDRARLAGLLAHADLVIENSGAGALARWGIDFDKREARLAQLSLTSVTPFGLTGPYAGYKADGIIAEAFSGTMLYQNRIDQMPVRHPGNAVGYLIGNFAAVGSLAAVTAARASGQGRRIDNAAVESLAAAPFRAPSILAYEYRDRVPHRARMDDGVMAIPYGVYPCADGYVSMVTTIQQLPKMLDMFGDDGLRDLFKDPMAITRAGTREAIDAVLFPWLLSKTRAEATGLAQSFGFPLTGVLSPEEVLEADHLHQRSFWTRAVHPTGGVLDFPGAPICFDEGGWALRRLAPALGEHNDEIFAPETAGKSIAPAKLPAAPRGKLPLAGIRVLDMTAVYSGPAVTLLLADLGAEVIRVENPWVFPPSTKGFQPRPTVPPELRGRLGAGYGPLAPDRPDRPYNRHSMNNALCRNKLSCAMDIRRPEGFKLFTQLADTADVLIENFKANSLPNMGIHPSALHARNPKLIVARLPPAGLTGDWAQWTGFGAQFDALTGFLAATGHRDSSLMETPMTIYMDGATGPAGAFAILSALHYRAATGRGQTIELAQTENIIQHLGDIYLDIQLTGRKFERAGNRAPHLAPQGLYPCSEGKWLAISVDSDAAWAALARIIGPGDVALDERFATFDGRRRHHDELDTLISRWSGQQHALAAFHLLQRAGVAAAPLMDEEMFVGDEHIRARGWMRPLHATDVGTHPHPGTAYQGFDTAWNRGAPNLGEDNEYVYKTILGVSDVDYERLREEKILAEDYFDKCGQPY